MENNQSPQQEITPNQFRKLCTDIFVNEILEELKPFEEKRKQFKKNHIQQMAIGFALISFTIILLSTFRNYPLDKTQTNLFEGIIETLGYVILALIIYITISPKFFEKKVKKVIMPQIFDKLPNFKWMKEGSIIPEEIKQFKLFGYFKTKENDDSLFCNYKDIKISIDECQLSRDPNGDILYPPFKGVLILLRTDHKLTNKPVIIKADGLKNGLNKLQNKIDNILGRKNNEFPDLQKINLEDVEFEKKYDVYCADQIEARYLLTTAFMERLNNIKFAFNADFVEASIINNKMLIAVYTHRDLFKLANIYKPIYNFNQYKTMVEEFASIIEMVDTLKINRNIGL